MTSAHQNPKPHNCDPVLRLLQNVLWFGFLVAFAVPVAAQKQSFTSGLLPVAGATVPLGERWFVSASAESVNALYFNPADAESYWGYQHQRTDLMLLGGMKINQNWKWGVGYLYRVRSGSANSHRSTQEISVKQRLSKSTLGHRLRLDQTFTSKAPWQFRVRYRFDIKLPLKAQAIKPGDFFLYFSDEVLYSIRNRITDFENRFVATLGYQISGKSAVQTGIDYRTDKYLTPGFRHRMWLKVGFSFNL